MGDVASVVVTHNAVGGEGATLLTRCLESVAGTELVVVDNGSADGTAGFVRERFAEASVVEQDNEGLAAGWSRGIEATVAPFILLLNADAWLLPGALDRLVAVAGRRPAAAIVGPRLRNPDGSLQRSVRGFPTVWRLATEYLYLRKLAPRTRALNAFYGAGFAHDSERTVEFLMGACLLVRRDAIAEVGLPDSRYFLFSEEVDWCYRFAHAGWEVVFTPEAECVHVGGASHGGRMYRENLRGHLRFMLVHHGEHAAERARRVLLAGVWLRAHLVRGERGTPYREAAGWLANGRVRELLDG